MENRNKICGSLVKDVFYDKMPYDKIKINWNKNPIEMSLFLSFLTVKVEISTNHLGYDTGWSLRKNEELKLRIGGGSVNGKEWLDSLQLGTKLSNPYNNYVNPFYLFDFMTKEGQDFFVEYYKSDIETLIAKQKESIIFLENTLSDKKELHNSIVKEYKILTHTI